MNEAGDSCYPTIEQQMRDTGLSNRCIITHINLAVVCGFLIKRKHGFSGQKWSNNDYYAKYPECATLSYKGSEPNDIKTQKVVNLTTEGSEPSDIKVVNEVHTNSPYNSPINSPIDSVGKKSQFDSFWKEYPRKEDKIKARQLFNSLIKKGVNHEELISGATRYTIHCRANNTVRTYIKSPKTWLNSGSWENEYEEVKHAKLSLNEDWKTVRDRKNGINK